MPEDKEQELDALLSRTKHLPSLPAVAVRVLELGEDPYAGLSEVASTIANDPALSARLLKAANSPLYAQRRAVDNLRQAVNLLGFNTTITLALSFSLQPAAEGGCVNKRLYWRRSLAAAISARVLAEQLQVNDSGRFFLAALLQDIGMLVLEQADAERYTAMLCKAGSHAELARREIETFGFDHARLGSRLLQRWHIPEPLWRAVLVSHALYAETRPELGDLLERCLPLTGPIADYWLGEHSLDEALPDAAHWAQQYLGMDAKAFDAVLNRIADLLPDYANLFEVELPTAQEAAHLLAEARDLLMLRNLKALQEAREYKDRSERLEARNKELERQTNSDPLTGLANRRHLNELLEIEFRGAQTEGWPLSLAFIDIDHFKQINDGHGHHAGDAVLKALARLMTRELRKTDLVARYGGEEFVALLPGTNEAQALKMMERLRRSVEAASFAVGDARIRFTLSVGLACMNDGSHEHFASAEDLLRAADRALYVAKHEGRNRCVVYRRTTD